MGADASVKQIIDLLAKINEVRPLYSSEIEICIKLFLASEK